MSGMIAAFVDVGGRVLLGAGRWRAAPWYAARLGQVLRRPVRIDGATIHLAEDVSPLLAGVLRLQRYEGAERYAVAKFLPRDRPVLELGAGIGAVACLVNRLLVDRRQHWVVEANSRLLPLIDETRRANGAGFHVIHGAIGYGSDTVAFGIDNAVGMSRVGLDQSTVITVPTLTFAELQRRTKIQKGTLIADIEGAEAALVEHEGASIAGCIRTIILEVHPDVLGKHRVAAMRHRLAELGFAQVWSHGDVWVLAQP
jgi:FkbM family methyltransferase